MNSASAVAAPIAAGYDRSTFEAFLETRDEPGWVSDLRRKAFAVYEEKLAVPLDPEEWKRVDLRAFQPGKYAIRPQASGAQFATLLADRAQFVGSVAHVDGNSTRFVLDESLAKKGVLFGDLATLVREHRDRIEPHLLTRGVKYSKDRFSAWHAAFWTGGTVLIVP